MASAGVFALIDFSVCDHGPWMPLHEFVAHIGGVVALDAAVKAGTAEVTEVTGGGGSIVLGRYVTRRQGPSLAGNGWQPTSELAERLGCTTRTICNWVKAGTFERHRVGNVWYARQVIDEDSR